MEVHKGSRLRGRVKCFYHARRFGFIAAQGKDFFFHNDINSKLSLREGILVEFIVSHDKRGRLQAKRIRLVKQTDPKTIVRDMRPSHANEIDSDSESEESDSVESSSLNEDEHRSSVSSSDDDISNVEQFEILQKNKSGCVQSFNSRKGFGFILNDDDKKKIFFHKNNCQPFGFHNKLSIGCYVKYDIARSVKKTVIEAINVMNNSSFNQNDKAAESDTLETDESLNGTSALNKEEIEPNTIVGGDSLKNRRIDASEVNLKFMVRMKSDIYSPNEANKTDAIDYLAHSNAFCAPEIRQRKGGNRENESRIIATREELSTDISEPNHQILPNQGLQKLKTDTEKPSDAVRKGRPRSKGVKASAGASKATPLSYSALCEPNSGTKPITTSTAKESILPKPTSRVSDVVGRPSGQADQASPETTSISTSDNYSGRYSMSRVGDGLVSTQTKPTARVSDVGERSSVRADQASPEATSTSTSEHYSGRYSTSRVGDDLATIQTRPTSRVSDVVGRSSGRADQASSEATSSTSASTPTSEHYSGRYSMSRVGDGLVTTQTRPTSRVSDVERRSSGRADQTSPEETSTSTSTSISTSEHYSGRYSMSRVGDGLVTTQTRPVVDRSSWERRLSSRAEQTPSVAASRSTSDHSGLQHSFRRDGVAETQQTKPTVDRSVFEQRLSGQAEQPTPETVSKSTSAYSGPARRVDSPATHQSKTAIVHPLNKDIEQLETNYKSYLNLGDDAAKKTVETVRAEVKPPSTTLVNGVRGTIVKSPQFYQPGEIKTLNHGTVSLPMRACHQYMGSSQLKPGTRVLFDLVYSDLNKDNTAVNIKTIQKNDNSCVVC